MKNVFLLSGMFLLAAGLSAAAAAQVQVVESGTAQTRGTTTPAGNDLMVSLYNQLQSLQEEVQSLRGIVEEQSNRLRRVETESRNRYLDIDNRLSALSAGAGAEAGAATDAVVATSPAGRNNGAAMPPAVPAGQGLDPRTTLGGNAGLPQVAASTGSPAVDPALMQLSEQELYRTALNLLLEEGKSMESAAAFDAYFQRFPQGRLLPNALYWQGEALILLARYPEALAAFGRVINEFPVDAKAAGAMLKSGVVQNLQGNRSEAERLWRELPSRFPDSASEITLARDYLSRP